MYRPPILPSARGRLVPTLAALLGISAAVYAQEPATTATTETDVAPPSTETATSEAPATLSETVVKSAPERRPDPAPAAPAPVSPPVVVAPPVETVAPLILDDEAPSTATGLPLTLKETPQSLSVIDRSRIETEGLFNQADVLRNTTGVYVTNLDSERTAYYSRGFEVQELKFDGLRSGTATDFASMPEDSAIYERIEVIRGSDGLLTGAGQPSATVNMVRKRPGKEFGGYLTGTVGTWDFGRLEGDINIPLTEDGRVRARFVGVTQERESFLDRYMEDKYVAYGILEADIGYSTTLSFGYSFQETDPRGSSWGAVPYYAADGSVLNLPRSTNWATNYSRIEQDSSNLFFQLEHRLDNDWTINTKYSHLDITKNWKVAYAGGGMLDLTDGSGMSFWRSYAPQTWGSGEEDVDSVSFDASGPIEFLGREHDLSFGFNYYRSVLNARDATETYSWSPVVPDIFNYNFNQPEPSLAYSGGWGDVTTEDYGTYGAIRLNPSDEVKVILGGRISQYKTYLDTFNPMGAFAGRSEDLVAEDVFTPYAGLVYDLTETLSAYFSYTDIFDPQRVFDYNRNLYDPVRGETYEVGLKKESEDRRWLGTASVFQTSQSNSFQTDWTMPFPDGSYPSWESGPIESQGLEFEINGRITDDWSLYASYTHVVTKDILGKDAASNYPDDMFKVYTNYRLPGALEKLSIGGGMRWQSAVNNIYWSGTNSIEQGGYAVFDLNAQYEISEDLTASMVVRNLFDKTYFANVGFYDGIYYGEPLNVQVSLKYEF